MTLIAQAPPAASAAPEATDAVAVRADQAGAEGAPLAFLDEIERLLESASVPWATLSDAQVVGALAKVDRVNRLLERERIAGAGAIAERSRRDRGQEGIAVQRGFHNGQALIEAVTGVGSAEAVKLVKLAEATGAGTLGDGRFDDGDPAAGGSSAGGSAAGGSSAENSAAGADGESRADATPVRFPIVARALRLGHLTSEFALAITTPLERVRPAVPAEQLADAEAALVRYAAQHTLVDVRRRASDWAAALSPALQRRRDRELRDRRSFTFGRQRDGMLPFHGLADPVSAALLKGAFDFRNGPTGPVFTDEGVDAGARARAHTHTRAGADAAARAHASHLANAGETLDGLPIAEPAPVADERTMPQKNFDALIGLITAAVRAEGEGKPRPYTTTTVIATVRSDDVERGEGIGWLEGIDEPVSLDTLKPMLCDGDQVTIQVGVNGEPLNFERDRRLNSSAQRLSVITRDGGCPIPGCTNPAHWSQMHHIVPWSQGGPTNVDNAIPPCAFHHTQIHEQGWTIRMHHGIPHLLVADDPDLGGKPRPISTHWSGPPRVPASEAQPYWMRPYWMRPYWMRLGRSRVLGAPDSAKLGPPGPAAPISP